MHYREGGGVGEGDRCEGDMLDHDRNIKTSQLKMLKSGKTFQLFVMSPFVNKTVK